MTTTAHSTEVHRMVDQLAPGQVEALYVILQGMVGASGDTEATRTPELSDDPAADWVPSPDAPVVRTLSIAGIGCGDRHLAAQSQEILRRELGSPEA